MTASTVDDLRLALEFADVADAIAMKRFGAADLDKEIKSGGGIVTDVDVAIETAFRALIERERPGDAVNGEEFGTTGDGPRLWTVDPLDGTAAFVGGASYWRTLISLVQDGVPVVGVVSRPAMGDRWWASKGHGALVNGRRVHVSDRAPLSNATIVEDFRVSVGRRLDTNPVHSLAKRCARVHPYIDDKGDFLRIAAGAIDVWVLWYAGSGSDLYSQACLVREAGGLHTDLDGRIDVDAPVQIVSNGRMHDEAIAYVNDEIAQGRVDPTVFVPEDIPGIHRARARQRLG